MKIGSGVMLAVLSACAANPKSSGSSAGAGDSVLHAPTGFAVVAEDGKVTLTWNPVDGAVSYAVTRATETSTPNMPSVTKVTTYTDTSVTNATTYYYSVAAMSAAGQGTQTAPLAATPLSPLDGWTVRHFSASLNAIAYGAGTFVAVGDAGVIRYSTTDGATWQSAVSPTTSAFTDVAFASQFGFVAVTHDGAVSSSTDGVTWHAHGALLAPTVPVAIACGGGHCVVVAFDPTVDVSRYHAYVSTDLVAWADALAATDVELYAIAYAMTAGGGGFVMGGSHHDGPTSEAHLFYAADGTSFTSVYSSPLVPGFNHVLASGGGFIATTFAGEACHSADGQTGWDQCSGDYATLPIAASGTQLLSLFTSDQSATRSLDTLGMTWSTAPAPLMRGMLNAMVYGSSHFVAVGEGGSTLQIDNAGNEVIIAQEGNILRVAAGNGRYLALGSNGVAYVSSDALSWTAVPGPVSTPIFDMVFANGSFYAVATAPLSSKILVYDSVDGASWSAGSDTGVAGQPTGMAVSETGRVVVVAIAFAATTTNHIAVRDAGVWSLHDRPTNETLSSITYGAGVFVAADNYRGLIATTDPTDPASWVVNDLTFTGNGTRVSWDGAAFVALSGEGEFLTSSEGFHFRSGKKFQQNIQGDVGAAATDGTTTLLYCGEPAQVFATTDLSNTKARFTSAPHMVDPYQFGDLIYANGRFILAGADGLIMTKP